MESKCKELAVVAMDFGTTFSGYAYSFKSEYKTDPKKISCNTKWTTGSNTYGSLKTPTTILLKWNEGKGDFEKINFGYDAQNKYTELVEEDEHKGYILLDRFKMDLYSESAKSGLQRNTELRLPNGQRINAMRVISMFIEYLKDHFFEAIKERKLDVRVSDIRWVLSVPAIWTDGAKQFMREAAEMADIPSSNLTIAFEPEAAALCCLHLTDPSKVDTKALLEKGRKCIVLDAGGGTVDFTVHEVSNSNTLVLNHEASGGPWGGTVVDDKLMNMLKDVFGEDVFKEFKKDNIEDLIGLYRDFEYKKRNIRDDQPKITLRFPLSLGQIYQKRRGEPIQKTVSEKYGDKVTVVKDKLRVDVDLVKKMFVGPCQSIVSHMKTLLRKEECKGIDTVLLVGGFGSSGVVRQSIEKNFPKLNVITPEDPELAVVKGAVLYGHNPTVVKSRIARYTYGVQSCKSFKEGVHPEDKKRVFDGIKRCTDIFVIHVTKGQKLKTGQSEPKQRCTAVSKEQTSIQFDIYVSTERNPNFVTDDSCTLIGNLTIDIPDTTGGLDRGVFVQMSFGETEMVVTATEEKTGKSVSVTLNFLG